ncbi:MAG: diguanylate cyclase (GGDEF)-like protein [Clostridium sp.]|jgi:diguanylate cyclase (GGDEF)-like protein
MKSTYLKSLFTQEISYETDIPLIRKQLLLSKLLLMILVVFTLLAFYHFFLSQEHSIVVIDLIALSAFMLASVSLHKYNNFNSAVTISTLTLFIFIVMFTIIDKNSNYGLIWTIFFPLFTILTIGHKKGIYFVLSYYLIIFYLSYSGVGVWESGKWNMNSFFHFSVASTIFVYTIFSIEIAQEEVHKELKKVHEREQDYMNELERLTITDPLTSLYNRRHLDKVYKREFYHAKRHDHMMAFYILDIDFFKQYNDTYGHSAGDDALIKVSRTMKTYFKRHEDFIFRLGGEEFGGLIIGTKASEIETFIAQLCVEISNMKIEHSGNKNQPILTVSIGMKILDDFENDDFGMVYKDADTALYHAKESGRNKAVRF